LLIVADGGKKVSARKGLDRALFIFAANLVFISHLSLITLTFVVFFFLPPINVIYIAMVVVFNVFLFKAEGFDDKYRGRLWYRAAPVLYYLVVFGINAGSIVLMYLFNGPHFLIVPIVAVFTFFYVAKKGVNLFVAAICSATILLLILYDNADPFILTVCGIAVVVILLCAQLGITKDFRPIAVAFAFLGFMCMMYVGIYFYGTGKKPSESVKNRPGIQYLFDGGGKNRRYVNLMTRRENRFLFRDCTNTYYILGTRNWFRKGQPSLARVKITRDDAEIKSIGKSFFGNNILLECPENYFYVASKDNYFFKIKVNPFKILKKVRIKHGASALDVHQGKNGDIFYIDEGTWIHRFDKDTLKETAVKVEKRNCGGNIRVDPVTGLVIFSGFQKFKAYDPITLKPVRSANDLLNSVEMDIDPEHRKIFGTKHSKSDIRVFDLDTLKRLKNIKTPYGIGNRFLEYDNYRDLLYVMNYANGKLMIIDAERRRILKEVYFGRKNRSVYLNPFDKCIYITTENGAFRADPDVLLGRPPSECSRKMKDEKYK